LNFTADSRMITL